MSKTQPLMVTLPAMLMLGCVVKDGLSTKHSGPGLWVICLVPSKQNNTVDFPVHTWKALGHLHRNTHRHTHTHTRTHE